MSMRVIQPVPGASTVCAADTGGGTSVSSSRSSGRRSSTLRASSARRLISSGSERLRVACWIASNTPAIAASAITTTSTVLTKGAVACSSLGILNIMTSTATTPADMNASRLRWKRSSRKISSVRGEKCAAIRPTTTVRIHRPNTATVIRPLVTDPIRTRAPATVPSSTGGGHSHLVSTASAARPTPRPTTAATQSATVISTTRREVQRGWGLLQCLCLMPSPSDYRNIGAIVHSILRDANTPFCTFPHLTKAERGVVIYARFTAACPMSISTRQG
ncbi:hypothetical protein KUC_3352 [Vreelandella boliviensis LC1]|uniref:Uncharacterized protein n=1 Tax=Vreelandella boliviensis LC1 TaxID=1072583 RepID=A0A7U9BZH1_9GAMM|nr:hypothetical protein KUC_3352 [Halomonas boliviensis LC1]